jgi:hypothetical protein
MRVGDGFVEKGEVAGYVDGYHGLKGFEGCEVVSDHVV